MNLRQLSVVLFFGITVSVGYGAGAPGGAELAPLDDQNPNLNLVVSKPVSFPGSNAIDGSSFLIGGEVSNPGSVTAPAPEPSTTALVGLGLLGVVALKLRRRGCAV